MYDFTVFRGNCYIFRSDNRPVLLVEDEAIIALNQKTVLEGNGLEVLMAHSCPKAVEAANGTPRVDMVLMDRDLGNGMDGTEAATEMRRQLRS